MSDSSQLQGFAPVLDKHCRAMVLGSFPGRVSLQAGNYYAHPRNQFWPIVSVLLDLPLLSLDFPARYEALLGRRVGLWDVIARCERRGSLDQAIRNQQPAGLELLVDQAPQLQYLLLNGKKAQSAARRILSEASDSAFTLIDLPSTSPAYAAMAATRKLEIWQAAFARTGLSPPKRTPPSNEKP